jgi:hypothetical protein
MGEILEVDLTELRGAADRVMAAVDQIAEIHWPSLDSDELRGSAVGGIAAPVLIAARLNDVLANMRGWAMAAHLSADAFERAESRNAGRVNGP